VHEFIATLSNTFVLTGREGSQLKVTYNSGDFRYNDGSSQGGEGWKQKLGLSMPPAPADPLTTQVEVARDCGLPTGDMANLLLVLGAGTVVRVTGYDDGEVNGHEAVLTSSQPLPSGIPLKLRHNGEERVVPAEFLLLVRIAPDLTSEE